MTTNTKENRYHGKMIDRFEDEYGHVLESFDMLNFLVIVFTDGEKIQIGRDWRGAECYLSEVEGRLL